MICNILFHSTKLSEVINTELLLIQNLLILTVIRRAKCSRKTLLLKCCLLTVCNEYHDVHTDLDKVVDLISSSETVSVLL